MYTFKSYTLKSELFPSFLIVLFGSIDCVTTAIGVLFFGASEVNPFLTGIVSTSIIAFLIVKISATILIGTTYIFAKRTLNKAANKESRSFRISSKLMKGAYAGLILFLIIVVVNNLLVLLA